MPDVLEKITEEQVVGLTSSLVRIPSENPTGDESQVAGFIADWLRSRGIEARIYEKVKGRSNVVAKMRGSADSDTRTLLFNGHIDTVPVGDRSNWTRDPFGAEVADGRLYGRGSSDMKGGVAAMMVAAEALTQANVQLGGNLLIAAVADEEMLGGLGTKYLFDEGLIRCDAAVYGEGCIMRPPYEEMDLVVAERGAVWLEAITHGRSAHGSVPHLGVNAVEKMARFILAMEKLEFTYTPHKLLSGPTVAAGTTIRGGFKENAVPDLCSATFDVRIVPGQTQQTVLADIQRLVSKLKSDDPDLKLEIPIRPWAAPCEVSEKDLIVRVARDAISRVTGRQPVLVGNDATTDARITAGAGIRSIPGCGPGSIHTAHIPDEYVETRHLLRSARIFAEIARGYLGTP